jgi:aspartate aminotransferase
VYSEQELSDIVRLADERGWWIISDEIYREFSYDAPATSVISVSEGFERLVVTNGMSKAFAMPGWRLGWSIAPMSITHLIVALQSHATAGAGNAGQVAAAAILDNVEEMESYLTSIRDAFRIRRDCALDAFRGVDGLEFVVPRGAFYCFFRTTSRGSSTSDGSDGQAGQGDAQQFCQRLLDAYDVTVVPGDAFGAPGWARASYSADIDSVREGFMRLAQFLRENLRA